MRRLLLFCSSMLCVTALLFGQARDTGSIFGSVTDSQGSSVPGATVTLLNDATGVSRTAITDQAGAFLFSLVSPGMYTVSITQTGFRKHQRNDLRVQANENVRVDAALDVGNVQETVTVTTDTAQVETRSATLNTVVDARRVVELPLNGRNPADLVLLAAGVSSGAGNNTGDAVSNWRPRGQKEISVNGSRNNNLRYTLDGGTNMDDLVNENLDFPFPNAVQEFSAQTSNMGVEQGGLSGGSVNVVTKSGTNQLHGDAFWFVRNTALNATNFFSRQQDQLKRNQFGFTAGGPFIKNKLFGFAGYQRLTIRQAAGNNQDLTLTAAERAGDFSGNPITIHDPLSGNPFAGNRIPSNRFSPAAVKLLSYSPLPDSDGFVRYSISQPDNALQGIGKLDYVPNAKHNLVFRVFESDGNTPFQSSPSNIHAVRYSGYRDSISATLGHTWVPTATTIVHSQFTGAHQVADIRTDFPLTMADLGVGLTPNGNHIDVVMTNSGVSFNRPLHAIRFGRGSLEFQQDWTMVRGSHTLVFGFNAVRKRFNNNTLYHSSGQFEFDGHTTGSGNEIGYDRADFLLGNFSFFTQNSGETEQRRGTQTGYYVGDTWRVNRRLTLSFGLRYEPYGLFRDKLNRNQTFDLAANKAGIRSEVFVNALPGLFYVGDKKPAGYGGSGDTFGSTVTDPDFNNFAPRIGFALDPFGDGKTSIRGGYALFYDAPSLNAQNDANNVTPFSYSVEFNDGSFDKPFLGRESLNIFPVSPAERTVPFPTPLYTIVLDKKFITPYTQNWSFTVEREVLANTLLRVGYVGTKATHLKSEYDQNAPIYNTNLTLAQNRADVNDRRPVADFQTISRWMHGLNSSYNSLQVSVDKRYAKGFTLSASYTWAKNLDYHSQNGFGGSRGINNPFNFFFSRGNSDLTRRQRFVTSFVWDLPQMKNAGTPVRAVLGNWKMSGLLTLQSGRPFSIAAANNPTAGAGSARADLVGSGYPVLDTSRSKGEKIAQYFDRTRFVNPSPNTFGTLGRNTMFGPGMINYDTSMTKAWILPFLGEMGLVEYRFEAFNLFNRTQLSNPITGLTNPNFGRITTTDGDARILQMALKIVF